MKHFQEQIQIMIDEKLSTYQPDELIDNTKQMYWYESTVWAKDKLNYEHSEQTFLQWANAYEAINGVQAADDFLKELAQQIVSEVEMHELRVETLNQMGQEEMR